MRRVSAALVLITALGLCAALGRAASYSFGKTTLSAGLIVIDNLTITATGSPKLVCVSPARDMEAGTMRLDSIRAKSIRVDVIRGKGKDLILKEALATGEVVIEARRADRQTDPSGRPVTVISDVHATAASAKLQDQNTVLLTGSVVLTVTERGKTEPVWAVQGQSVTYLLKENRIEIKGQDGKPAELTATSGEEEKK
ncbi:MAG TPA: hypothetical protein VMX94_03220 [Armatimonadota bacterium]|nr:hypothetical protein [Armatimonadota bacterium]